MGKIDGLIIYLLWAVQAMYYYFTWLYWIQVKEYRYDRFTSFLKTSEGISKLGLIYQFLKYFIFLLIFTVIKIDILLIGYFFILDTIVFLKVAKGHIRYPVFTKRIIKICVMSIIFLTIGLIIGKESVPEHIILIETLIVLGSLVGIAWTSLIVKNVRVREIKQAGSILDKSKPKIIGITGSYGKTTTKDFIYTFLSNQFIVEKTQMNENTDLGIARKIINDFKKNTQIFLCEMGAYKRGEIKNICSFVHPDVSIVTGIEPQHLDLFGSIENIIQAKYEIIDSLASGGVALFNTSNPYCLKMKMNTEKKRKDLTTYSYETVKQIPKERLPRTMYSKITAISTELINFDVFFESDIKSFSTHLKGFHFVENITCAILLARLFEVSWNVIQDAINSLETPKGTMKSYQLAYGSTLIDDSYNCTPASFESAVSYSSYFKNHPKLMVTSGVIELGKVDYPIHKKLARKVDGVFNKIVLTRKGIGKIFKDNCKQTKVQTVQDDSDIIKEIESYIEKGYFILIEGRQPSGVMKFIEQRKI